ncbi:unnamed protein product [Sphagnum jensenii]
MKSVKIGKTKNYSSSEDRIYTVVETNPGLYWSGTLFYDNGGPKDVYETEEIQDATEVEPACGIDPWRTKDNYPKARFVRVHVKSMAMAEYTFLGEPMGKIECSHLRVETNFFDWNPKRKTGNVTCEFCQKVLERFRLIRHSRCSVSRGKTTWKLPGYDDANSKEAE